MDVLKDDEKLYFQKKLREVLDSETGRDRIKRMYSLNEYNSLSPELLYIIKGGYISAVFGGIFGCISAMNQARWNFLRSNQGTPFDSEHLARSITIDDGSYFHEHPNKSCLGARGGNFHHLFGCSWRKLTDSMTLTGMRAMFSQGFKLGSFTTAYMLLTLTAANYNNKATVWEHVGAGAILGSVSRFKYGPKGMLVAGLLGGTLGLFAGGMIKTSMWLSGTTIQDLRYWQHEYYSEQFTMKRKENEKKASNQQALQ